MATIGQRLPSAANLHQTLNFEVENFEKNMLPHRQTDLGIALWRITFGSLSAIGKELFHIERTQETVRKIEVLKNDCELERPDPKERTVPNLKAVLSQASAFFKEETFTAQLGLLAQAGYLGSLVIAGLGYVDKSAFLRWTGITGALLCSGYFFFNAASHSQDSAKAEISSLKTNLKGIKQYLDKKIEAAGPAPQKVDSTEPPPPPYTAPSAPGMTQADLHSTTAKEKANG